MRRTLLALAVSALVAGLTACGGVSSTLDPVAAAASKSAKAGGVKVSISASFTAAGAGGTMTAQGRFDQDEGELTFDLSDLLRQTTLPRGAGAGGEVKVIYTKEDGHSIVYVGAALLGSLLPSGQTWIRADVDRAASLLGSDFGQLLGQSSQSPAQTLDLLRGAGEVEKIGPDTVDGVQVTQYRATVDLAQALELRGIPESTVQELIDAGASTTLPIDVWIGNDDGLVHRIRMAYEATPNGQPVSTQMTMTMSDWGTEVAVEPPPADQVFDVTELATGLGKS